MLRSLSGNEIRQTFLNFFAERGHKVMPSASLVPEDPTVLLTIAGMLPFKPIFLGQKAAEVPRATSSQKCIRTNDIENVGRTARHHTFFEMLGNFSFGDYFKPEAIAWAWELVTKEYSLPPERLVVSVFRDDDDAYAIWRDRIGVPEQRIRRMDEADNFWASGPTGPCGPCSEIYYDFKPELGDGDIDLEDDSRFLEIYNLVFMELNRDAEGTLTPLEKQNIDTGMGLERMAQVLQGVPNNYETDLVFPIVQAAAEIAGIDYDSSEENVKVSLKVIGDHVRSAIHMIADGITADRGGRGYVLRRLIRRVVRHGRRIGIDREFVPAVAETAIALFEDAYPHVRTKADAIKAELQREEEQFRNTLERGEKLLAEILVSPRTQKHKKIEGRDAFILYDTYGFPLELTQETAAEHGLAVDTLGFEAEMIEQQKRSKEALQTIDLTVQGSLEKLARELEPTEFLGYTAPSSEATVAAILSNGETVSSASAGAEVQVILDQTPFYAESGGQIGDRGYLLGGDRVVRVEDVQKQEDVFIHFGRVERGSLKTGDRLTATIDRTCRRGAQIHHTATHLLQAALKSIVDDSISQAGSLVAFDRLRFDFNSPKALTPEQVQQVEALMNAWIGEAHNTQIAEMPIAEAKAKGAVAMFGEKYGEVVRVIDVPGVSMELCGGTHVANTAEIGVVKIVSEAGVSAGVRRIEAVAGPAVLPYVNERDAVVKELTAKFKAKPQEIPARVNALQEELKAAQKAVAQLKSELAIASATSLLGEAQTIGNFQAIVAELPGAEAEALKSAASTLLQKLGEGAVVLGSAPAAGKVAWVAAFSPGANQAGLQAGKFIGAIAKLTGGGGGGRPNFAQAGGRDASKLPEALEAARTQLFEALSG
ncbi:alanine--tRNA ligase [Synechococcus sp. PCC 7336]|uniref:alanine--tRNA ligase n=1 Tax=Synechococcus sp. PCC 7336 TaxID=195250 RepID=UPI00034DCFC2|nr:alanine--tRNA ligase [Synechococcus sp. PCC 7336]